MNAGLEIYNDNNKLVIDENYRNLSLTRKVLLTDLPRLNPGYRGFVLALAPDEEIFAFSLLYNKHFILYPYRIAEDQWVLHPADGDSSVGYTMTDEELVGVYVYVFGLQGNVSSNYGLVVYDKRGKVCFDSNQKYMRVRRYYHKNYMYDTSGVEVTYSLSDGKDYAIVYTAAGKRTDTYSNGLYFQTVLMPRWDGFNDAGRLYRESNHLILYYPGNSHDQYAGQLLNAYGYMIIDVTDY